MPFCIEKLILLTLSQHQFYHCPQSCILNSKFMIVSREGTEFGIKEESRGRICFRNLFLSICIAVAAGSAFFWDVSMREEKLKSCFKDTQKGVSTSGIVRWTMEHMINSKNTRSRPIGEHHVLSVNKSFVISREYKCFSCWLMKASGINLTM